MDITPEFPFKLSAHEVSNGVELIRTWDGGRVESLGIFDKEEEAVFFAQATFIAHAEGLDRPTAKMIAAARESA